MLECKFWWFLAKSACFDTPEGWVVGGGWVVGNSDIKANSVQLQLPTGTELGNNLSPFRYFSGESKQADSAGNKQNLFSNIT